MSRRPSANVFAATAVVAVLGLGVFDVARAQDARYQSFFTATAAPLVPGYRLPVAPDFGPVWSLPDRHSRAASDGSGIAKAPFWTSGRFNDDETLDYAYILIHAATGERALFAFLSDGPIHVAVPVERELAYEMILATRGAGRYATAAAKGFGRPTPDDALEYVVGQDGIDFILFEGSASTFVWDEELQSFARYWYSD